MPRIVIIALAGCFYAALVGFIVSREGQSYRESLRLDRERATEPIAADKTTPVPRPEPDPAPPPAPALHVDPPVAASTAAPLPEVEPKAKIAEAEVAVATPDESIRRTNPSPTDALPKPLAAPPLLANTPEREWADSLDLAHLTTEQEARLGRALNGLILATNPVDRDGDLRRVKLAAAPLLELVTRKDVEYTFTILDSDEVNAFSLPGGFIYVSRGLFRLCGEATAPEEDYTLQFAVGHEIAHVDMKHAISVITGGGPVEKVAGMDALAQFMLPVAMGYPDAMEFAADRWTYQQMRYSVKRTRRESLMFLIRLQGFAESNGFKNGRMPPEPASRLTLAENHFRAHTAAWDRLDRLKAMDGQALKAAPARPPLP